MPWYSPPDILRDLEGIDSRLRFSMILNSSRRRGWSEQAHNVDDPGEPGFEDGWANTNDGDWHMPTLSGGNQPCGFHKDQNGFVYLHGTVSTTGPGQTIFTLPPGYRPERFEHHDTVAGLNDPARVPNFIALLIQPTGEVIAGTSGVVYDWVFLDNHRWRAYG